ncbi:MAG: Spy/CpxP family protein refolding chaperone [Vicinamibacterales bacterium]|jgi:Spy/CpxP family protein refolding chaperone|nr:hypothetical protein [Acidobacteriota bacterium]MDP7294671.1 Spy/CpxP family protein refolding chaperone [Vicinamibacterales bacterium]MDP7670783.1 Spy/CpxP family protein refolding chaperone [Vicinamibacterales bacterium]HJO37790.1 Spy/CpxP family protein refolding chaperone [Vicinamibacterales bacterium]|tara:strand:+ start:1127 stop:1639 length:513 start_codon:yes stop_codon:yes gene_type:complete
MRSRTSKARGIGLTLGVASLVAAGLVAVSPNLDAAGQQGFGRGQRGSMDRGRGSAVMRGLRELDLSEAQRTEIREIVSGERDTQAELRERSTPIREALRLAAEATPIDEALIRRHSAELAEVQADAMILQANIRSEVLAVLTPEQRAEAAELRGGRERRMEERRARRGNR